MKIRHRRNDGILPRARDFQGWVVEVLAPVVVERFDQRRAGRHGGFSAERVIGQTDQIMRAIEQSLGHQMRHVFRTALDVALGHTTILAMPVSSSSVMNTTPLALPGRCRTSTTPAQRIRRLSLA